MVESLQDVAVKDTKIKLHQGTMGNEEELSGDNDDNYEGLQTLVKLKSIHIFTQIITNNKVSC